MKIKKEIKLLLERLTTNLLANPNSFNCQQCQHEIIRLVNEYEKILQNTTYYLPNILE